MWIISASGWLFKKKFVTMQHGNMNANTPLITGDVFVWRCYTSASSFNFPLLQKVKWWRLCSDFHTRVGRNFSSSSACYISSYHNPSFLFLLAHQPSSGPGLPHSLGFYITHNDTQQSVGLLWTSDYLVAETST